VAWASLGYQTMGTEMLRPSLKSTDRVSSVTVTLMASGISSSIGEVRIPRLYKVNLTFCHYFLNPSDFITGKSGIELQTHWIKPEFCCLVLSLDMYMVWLITVTGIEEKTVRPKNKDGWQILYLLNLSL
jgi:hypothetical protein